MASLSTPHPTPNASPEPAEAGHPAAHSAAADTFGSAGTAPGDTQDPAGDLLALLRAQEKAYSHLRQVADERHAALAAADLARLGDLLGREQPLLTRLRKLETSRLRCVAPWAERLGVTPDQLTVTDLCSLADDETAAALLAAKVRLLAGVEALAAANRRNAELLETCLESVNASVHHLLQAVQFSPRYASNGNRIAPEDTTSRLADLKA